MRTLRSIVVGFVAVSCLARAPAQDALARALDAAGDNATALRTALERVPDAERAALRFLIENMPERDLRTLAADFVLDDVHLAHTAWREAPWADRIPDDVFLDALLPYANVTESREPWRARLRELCLPLVADATTPGDAAQRLNERLFSLVGVRYSTTRRRADQSPSESIAQGVASCTGLSILLVDACRSVGVPARLAGIASWPNKPGNHTWVEVWDGEAWRFTGAAEYDAAGLDRGWFVADAALADSTDPRHAIWAVTWRATGQRFPLVWARDVTVHAVDVTARYARKPDSTDSAQRLWVDVRDGAGGPRVAAHVELTPTRGDAQVGTAKGEGADTNDHLEFAVSRGSAWRVRVAFEGRETVQEVTTGTDAQQLVTVVLPQSPSGADALALAARAYFGAAADARDAVEIDPAADAFVASAGADARRVVWDAYREAPLHAAARADFDAQVVRTADRQARYVARTVGERPVGGYALVIAMHGGGGVATAVNDQQWRVMQRYYRDHPEDGGYVYVALRAPNDAWNGFYDDAIAPLVEALIRQFTVFGDVDPDRVFAIGYSHGGYGAFALGPKIPDRFAAVHASAAAPTPGVTVADNLRNLRFSFMVGTRDTAYGRLERCDAFAATLESLRAADPHGFPTMYERIEGNPHTGLPDRDKLATLIPLVRNPVPTTLRWRPTDGRITDQYWLEVPAPRSGQALDAVLADGTLAVTTTDVDAVISWLDERLIGAQRTLVVRRDGEERTVELTPHARDLCASLLRRGDPALAFSIRLELPASARR